MVELLSRITKAKQSQHRFSEMVPLEGDSISASLGLTASQTYFSLSLSEMFLKERSRLGQDFSPKVFAITKFSYAAPGEDTKCEMPRVIGRDMLKDAGLDSGAGMTICENIPLAGPVPYCGDNIEVMLALFKTVNKDLIGDALSMVQNVTEELGPALGPYLKIASNVSKGVIGLLNGRPEDALFAYVFNIMATGSGAGEAEPGVRDYYRVFIDCADTAIDKSRLFVRATDQYARLHYRNDDGSDARFTGENYCLLHIRVADKRDDYERLPFFKTYINILAIAPTASLDDIKKGFYTLLSEIDNSPDLTSSQKNVLPEVFLAGIAERRNKRKSVEDALNGLEDNTTRGVDRGKRIGQARLVDQLTAAVRNSDIPNAGEIAKALAESKSLTADALGIDTESETPDSWKQEIAKGVEQLMATKLAKVDPASLRMARALIPWHLI